jgi:hypothetical protein
MAESDVERRARRKAYLRGHLDTAQAAALKTQPANTQRAYRKPQRDFKVSNSPNGCTVY